MGRSGNIPVLRNLSLAACLLLGEVHAATPSFERRDAAPSEAVDPPAVGWSEKARAPAADGTDPMDRDATKPRSEPAFADRTNVCKPGRLVFGFLPYWSGTSNIRWDLLTHLACFDLRVDAAGNVTNAIGWPWTSTINVARANDVKVIITVTNFTPSQILSLVTSVPARTNFFNQLKTHIDSAGADGVCIDFEGVATNGWPSHLPAFLQALRTFANSQPRPWEIHIATPAVNWNGSWPLSQIAPLVDSMFLMGYDYYGSWSSTTGPSAPFTGGSINVNNSLRSDYGNIINNFPRKIVLGVPWYGNRWSATTSNPYSPVISHTQSVTYATAASQVLTHGRLWDATSQTPWYRWQTTNWNQVWYDDAQSLGIKYDQANRYNLAGVGMWALGYQGSSADMWTPIADRFPVVCSCPCDLNFDDVVDNADFAIFANAYNLFECPSSGACPGDFNGDRVVDNTDFALFAAAYASFECP